MSRLQHPTAYKFTHYRLGDDGERYLIWGSTIGEIPIGDVRQGSRVERYALSDMEWLDNNLVDAGEEQMLDVYFRGATGPTNFFGRLYNDTPTETDTLSTLTGEVTGSGYPGTNTIERSATGFPTLALDAGDFRASSKTLSWTAGGSWSAATHFVLATVASGTAGILVAYRALSATRTLATNDVLNAAIQIKLA